MLRAQLEQRKKAILQRINKEGKDKLEKVCNRDFLLLIFIVLLFPFGAKIFKRSQPEINYHASFSEFYMYFCS